MQFVKSDGLPTTAELKTALGLGADGIVEVSINGDVVEFIPYISRDAYERKARKSSSKGETDSLEALLLSKGCIVR